MMKIKTVEEAKEVVDLLKHITQVAEADKILSSFLSPWTDCGILKPDGSTGIHGTFRMGGTVSGRMSSSDPNLQNIPSTGSTYAKLVKRCFSAPTIPVDNYGHLIPEGEEGEWLFCGADFNSLNIATS